MTQARIWTAALLAACTLVLPASRIRTPRDTVGFCWTPDTMNRLVSLLETTRPLPPAPPGWVAAICPHDDYLYAARLYRPLFVRLQAREVVIIGVTHGSVRRAMGDPRGKIILDSHDSWTGLGRPVALSGLREWLRQQLPPDMYMVSNKAHELEHSIEAMIPFLQHYHPDVHITPIMVTAMSPERVTAVSRELAVRIAAWMRHRNLVPGRDLAILISADGNHYGRDFDNRPFGEDRSARETAEAQERRLIRECLEGEADPTRLERLQHRLDPRHNSHPPLWCGRYSIPFGLMTAVQLMADWSPPARISGRLLVRSDTWTEGVLPLRHTSLGTTAPFSLQHWVGFFSMAFYPRPEG